MGKKSTMRKFDPRHSTTTRKLEKEGKGPGGKEKHKLIEGSVEWNRRLIQSDPRGKPPRKRSEKGEREWKEVSQSQEADRHQKHETLI